MIIKFDPIESKYYCSIGEDVVESLHRRISQPIYLRVVVVTRTSLYRAVLTNFVSHRPHWQLQLLPNQEPRATHHTRPPRPSMLDNVVHDLLWKSSGIE